MKPLHFQNYLFLGGLHSASSFHIFTSLNNKTTILMLFKQVKMLTLVAENLFQISYRHSLVRG